MIPAPQPAPSGDRRLRLVQEALNLTSAQAAVTLRMYDHKLWASATELQRVAAEHLPTGRPWAVQQGVDAIRLKTQREHFILGHAVHGWTLGAPGVRRAGEILSAAGGDDDA